MDRADSFKDWSSLLLEASSFSVGHLPLRDSKYWSIQDGAIRHKSDRFFRVVGLQWDLGDGRYEERPFLDQWEIGTLGFLMREKEGKKELLLQAKIEPGNVGVIQFAPTCQATESNANRVHGGEAPLFVEYFNGRIGSPIYDVLQSEQGTRFYHKRNRNVLVETTDECPLSPSHRWVVVEDLLDLLRQDFLVNTDARSVLICSPWEKLVGREPFSRYKDEFGKDLYKSASCVTKKSEIDSLKSKIIRKREKIKKPAVLELSDLKSWSLNEGGVSHSSGRPFKIIHIDVEVKGREVPSWDQPIIESVSEGSVTLVCGRMGGVLKFLFQAKAEPGLWHKVELTPSVVSEPGTDIIQEEKLSSKGKLIVECRQSEEGGRFFKDINIFRIVDVGDMYETPEGYYWLTLSEIRELLDEEGWFTNESRSALSLLLPWL